ncbi:hypothetical protein U9M48_014343 [Paspalum notatum var. saurae]|uniref:At1g61320/AtMIF1 LRR domain-containing protein n=1 Tax=Paspalum notatum var. saurae TaxID=547442 RepID=A0AAQ3T426_PASNO
MKNLIMCCPYAVCYACAEVLSIMPNLETLVLGSKEEVVNTPMLPIKFLNLKNLKIDLSSGWTFPPSYDYCSLVSFLDASPALETLVLDISGDPSQLRQIPEHRHCCLKSVEITGFSSAKSLVELTCYILKNAVSLECLTLDTLYGSRCSDENSRNCTPFSMCFLRQARRAIKFPLQSSLGLWNPAANAILEEVVRWDMHVPLRYTIPKLNDKLFTTPKPSESSD